MQNYISIEISLTFIAIILGVLWVIDPAGNYEPFLVILGLVLTALEILRRRSSLATHTGDMKNALQSEHSVVLSDEVKRVYSNITVREIVESIRSAPPYQKKEVAKQYFGINVEWVGYLNKADVDFRDTSKVRVKLNVNREDVIGYSIWFSESIIKFPEIRILKSKAAIRVTGKILSASSDGLCVELEPIEIRVIEDYNV